MRGRRPKPTHLKLIEGNRGKRRINRREPKPRGCLVDPPAWFNDAQVAAWRYAIDQAPAGLLTTLDRGVMVVWTVAACIHQEAVTQLGRSAPIIRAPHSGEPMQNPFLPIINKQAVVMLRAGEQLGFSPASRGRVEVEVPDEGEDDQFFNA